MMCLCVCVCVCEAEIDQLLQYSTVFMLERVKINKKDRRYWYGRNTTALLIIPKDGGMAVLNVGTYLPVYTA